MSEKKSKSKLRAQARMRRARLKIRTKSNRVRLSVFRTSKHIYAQLIDDSKGSTVASASTLARAFKELDPKPKGIEAAKWVGQEIAKRAKEADVKEVVFDKGSFLYHGRVKALADAAREAGLDF